MSTEATTSLTRRYRHLTNGWRLASVALPGAALVLAVVNIFNMRPFGFMVMESAYSYLLIGAFLPLVFLWIPISPKSSKEGVPWYDIVLAAVAAGASLYFATQQWESVTKGWDVRAPTVPFIVGIVVCIVMIEAARRTAGSVFAGIVLFFAVYPLFAAYMPAFLQGPGYTLNRVVGFHAFSSMSILGIPIQIFSRLLFGYMAFAVVIQALGAGRLFTTLALAMIGNRRAGNAKIAVVASGLFGMISGSAVANVIASGSFTIPAMKKDGMPAFFAGGVEACSSSGGQLLPPVMGATAFVMAQFLGVSYAEVCVAAFVPALLYYMCLFVQIDCFAARKRLKPLPIEVKSPTTWRVLADHFHIILGFIALILVLFLLRLESEAPWLATALMVVLAMFRKATRLSVREAISLIENIGRTVSELVGMLAPVGMIIGSFIISGLAFSFPEEIIALAGNNLYILLVFGALTCFVLGMGISITAVYIFLALVLAPLLVNAGLDPMAVHLFIFYWAMTSLITPPVAVAAYAASAIAGADPMRTGLQACRLGGAIYLLPFVFVFNPALILRGSVVDMLWVIPTAAVGLVIVGSAFAGYLWMLGPLRITARVLLFVIGILVVAPSVTTSIIGMGAFVVLFAILRFLRAKKNLVSQMMLESN